MRISTCFNLRAKPIFETFSPIGIENLGQVTQIFFMRSKGTPFEPEILSPAAQLRSSDWSAKQEAEEIELMRLEGLANLMDARFQLPFLPMPIGLDALIGLIPGIGDTISLGVAGGIVGGARRLGISSKYLSQMGLNIFVDWLIGLIPVIGDLFDIGWQGNIRNVRIARAQLEDRWDREYAQIVSEP